MKLFFDTSAFAKRYINESGSDEVELLCGKADAVAVSMVCPTEVISAFDRLKREKRLTFPDYARLKRAFLDDLVDVTLLMISSATIKHSFSALEQSPVKAMDALNIASALLGTRIILFQATVNNCPAL